MKLKILLTWRDYALAIQRKRQNMDPKIVLMMIIIVIILMFLIFQVLALSIIISYRL